MIFSKNKYIVTGFLFVFLNAGCNQSYKSNSELASIDLLRGEIALCGNPEFGELSFSLACQVSSRETFDLAISLLHSFEYAEAEKAFVKVIDADPECSMAYWGVAMSMYHSLWAPPSSKELEKGSKLLEIAESLPKSERAAAYLDAIGAFYKDWAITDYATRSLLYEKKMEAIYNSKKDDTEAAIFYALAVTASADPTDKTYKSQRKSGKILEELFVAQPNHPGIAHYIIHTYDYPEVAELALATARRYAEIAPASAHAQHMPSHIFTRLGLWEESINTNINSASSAVCYSEGVAAEGHWSQEIHAMDYLVYAYLQLGNNEKVKEQNDYLKSMKKVFPPNHFAVAYTANAIPARIALENRQWTEAANLQKPKLEFDWEAFPWEQSILHFARAIGSARSSDIASAEKELSIIKSLHAQLTEMGDEYKTNQVLIEIKTTQAWIQFAKGNHEEAISLMTMATDMEDNTSKHPVTPGEVLPARELLGDMFLEMNKPMDALEAYELELIGRPGRFNGIYGAASAAKQLGNHEKATLYFNMLLRLTENSNSDRPEIEEAKEFIGVTRS